MSSLVVTNRGLQSEEEAAVDKDFADRISVKYYKNINFRREKLNDEGKVVEIEYFIALCELKLPELMDFDPSNFKKLRKLYENFSTDYAVEIKQIEKITNHDIKALEYFIKKQFDKFKIGHYKEFIHFGLTSQDINNTAIPLSVKKGIEKVTVCQV